MVRESNSAASRGFARRRGITCHEPVPQSAAPLHSRDSLRVHLHGLGDPPPHGCLVEAGTARFVPAARGTAVGGAAMKSGILELRRIRGNLYGAAEVLTLMPRRIMYFAPLALLLAALGPMPACLAQEPAPGRALGAVTRIDAAARQISLQTTTGEVAVTVDAKAKVLRVAPGATNLSNAAAIQLTDINVGDRLRARGRMTEDQKSLAALEIVVISQSDIASKQAAERADWDRRGATGIVADVAADSV